jgi:hypothetical protein
VDGFRGAKELSWQAPNEQSNSYVVVSEKLATDGAGFLQVGDIGLDCVDGSGVCARQRGQSRKFGCQLGCQRVGVGDDGLCDLIAGLAGAGGDRKQRKGGEAREGTFDDVHGEFFRFRLDLIRHKPARLVSGLPELR